MRSFDVIFLIAVIGEVQNKDSYIEEFYRLLRKGGLLSISELKGDPDKLTTDEVKKLLRGSGFIFDAFFGNEKNYTINFRKKIGD